MESIIFPSSRETEVRMQVRAAKGTVGRRMLPSDFRSFPKGVGAVELFPCQRNFSAVVVVVDDGAGIRDSTIIG